MSKKRTQYTDDFRAGICLQLEAAGYPHVKGALTRVANANKVHARTISRWFNAENNPVPDKIVNEKRFDMVAAMYAEIQGILADMPSARKDALYRELGTVFGILVDKIQLLTGGPTERTAVTYDIEWDDNLPHQSQAAPRSTNGAARPVKV